MVSSADMAFSISTIWHSPRQIIGRGGALRGMPRSSSCADDWLASIIASERKHGDRSTDIETVMPSFRGAMMLPFNRSSQYDEIGCGPFLVPDRHSLSPSPSCHFVRRPFVSLRPLFPANALQVPQRMCGCGCGCERTSQEGRSGFRHSAVLTAGPLYHRTAAGLAGGMNSLGCRLGDDEDAVRTKGKKNFLLYWGPTESSPQCKENNKLTSSRENLLVFYGCVFFAISLFPGATTWLVYVPVPPPGGRKLGE